jgi:hypothetical protein
MNTDIFIVLLPGDVMQTSQSGYIAVACTVRTCMKHSTDTFMVRAAHPTMFVQG